MATAAKVNLAEKLALFDERRQPKIIGTGRQALRPRAQRTHLPGWHAAYSTHGGRQSPRYHLKRQRGEVWLAERRFFLSHCLEPRPTPVLFSPR